MTGWDNLEAELDRWAEGGRIATFWWRDDDVTRPTPALDVLLRIAGEAAAPLALAVIPADAQTVLADRLAAEDGVDVLQHGYAHHNHEPPDHPKSEFGPSRSTEEALHDLVRGRKRMDALFGARALPVFVPPWNRMESALAARLSGLGFRGVSAFKPRGPADADGPPRVNTHVDIVDWKGARGYCGDAAALTATLDHLEKRRKGMVDADEPTGILSHHLVHDGGCTAFLDRFAALVAGHPAAIWVPARRLFAA